MAVLLLFMLVAIFADLLTPYDPLAASPLTALVAPGSGHLLGTDSIGRDVLSRILFGGRISLTIGFLSVGSVRLHRRGDGFDRRVFRR